MADSVVIPDDRIPLYNPQWLDSILAAAEVALTAIVDVAAMNDVELPAKQLVYVGTVPRDCELVAVSVSTYGFGRPGDPRAGPSGSTCWLPGVVTLNAEITRCVPEENQVRAPGRYASGVVQLPETAAMEDHARTVMQDMMILLEASSVASNYPYDGAGAESNVMVTDPSGGMQSTLMTLTMQV